MNDRTEDLAVGLFSELFMADQLARARLSKALPKGMEECLQVRLRDHFWSPRARNAFHSTENPMDATEEYTSKPSGKGMNQFRENKYFRSLNSEFAIDRLNWCSCFAAPAN